MPQIATTTPVFAQPIDPTRLFGKFAMPRALQIFPFWHIWAHCSWYICPAGLRSPSWAGWSLKPPALPSWFPRGGRDVAGQSTGHRDRGAKVSANARTESSRQV